MFPVMGSRFSGRIESERQFHRRRHRTGRAGGNSTCSVSLARIYWFKNVMAAMTSPSISLPSVSSRSLAKMHRRGLGRRLLELACRHQWIRARGLDGSYGLRCQHCMKPYHRTWNQLLSS